MANAKIAVNNSWIYRFTVVKLNALKTMNKLKIRREKKNTRTQINTVKITTMTTMLLMHSIHFNIVCKRIDISRISTILGSIIDDYCSVTSWEHN